MTVGHSHLLIFNWTRDCLKQLRCIPNIQRLTEEDSIFWFYLFDWRLTEYHASDMVYTRQKSRADANPKYIPRTQHKINIHEVLTPSRTVFTQEQNELFVQQVVRDAQSLELEFFIIIFLV